MIITYVSVYFGKINPFLPNLEIDAFDEISNISNLII